MQLPVPHFEFTVSAGNLLLAAAVLGAVWKAGRLVKSLSAPIREFISEHNVLWEDYNIRVGGTYRRATGRGAPLDPEEYYRGHPDKIEE